MRVEGDDDLVVPVCLAGDDGRECVDEAAEKLVAIELDAAEEPAGTDAKREDAAPEAGLRAVFLSSIAGGFSDVGVAGVLAVIGDGGS